jgi:hypothetical protein
MVISMVAAGFAAAPAAAIDPGQTVNAPNEELNNNNYEVNVGFGTTPVNTGGTAILTYNDSSGDAVIAGLETVEAGDNSVDIYVEDTSNISSGAGTYQTHITNTSDLSGNYEIGDTVSSETPSVFS